MKLAVLGAAVCTSPVVADFMWGTATAAYQVEGYRTADGRQASIWDAFDTPQIESSAINATKPNGKPNVFKGENAAEADADYVRFKDSVQLVDDLGFGAARLSISWSRVLNYHIRNGRLTSSVNQAGIEHYREVLKEYKSKGIQTAVTIFHWDLPLVIEEFAAQQECGSAWLCHEWMPAVFAKYAELLIQEYKEDADWWITLNEPLTVIANGYANGGPHAPGRCSDREKCWAGDDMTEPYAAAKGLILAHAEAFKTWEKEGRPGKGLGITLNADWRVPATGSKEDKEAAVRAIEWESPIFFDPLFFGEWPASIVKAAGDRLPAWTDAEKKLVKGAHDGHFFMNSYTSMFAKAGKNAGCGFGCDAEADLSGYDFTTKAAIGTPSTNGWLFNYGPGLGELVNFYNNRWPGLSYIITENGWGSATKSEEEEMTKDDLERCNYYRDYLGNLSSMAAKNNIKVDGYFAWSLMDNYEWADGFQTRFGLVYVDYRTQKRTPKMSARWFKKFITNRKELPTDGKPFPACDPQLLSEKVGEEIIV
eukprot:TRINITY_DN6062_c0_g1_i6.p1 TRINITY_DN6062_c0_g1~~TRINITY_DN6062_c0_g1_i6.p1  ORF type:complete len:563 (+),score=116.08 TRINITY_DN6062_c0_g1_i6:84-1691(+)